MKKSPANIIISRTDSIGDVVLSLPMARLLKERFPAAKIAFMGKAYTKQLIETCEYIDFFIDVKDFFESSIAIDYKPPEVIIHVYPVKKIAERAKELNIPLRIGTAGRTYHLYTCNKLVYMSRKRSNLHEAQLNLKLLQPFNMHIEYSLNEIKTLYGLTHIKPLNRQFLALIDPNRFNVILHPKSQGSGREWGIENFINLVKILDKTRFKIFISGVENERKMMADLFTETHDMVTDLTGFMQLDQFISFIKHCDGLVASGTGPLHIAAALGIHALGIFPPIKPIHPGRWQPLGLNTQSFVLDKDCSDCKNDAQHCHCIKAIPPSIIQQALSAAADRKVTLA